MEAVIDLNEKNIYFYFDEEGPDTFLYVNNLGNNIRFIHLSSRKQFSKYIEIDDYRILQDIIISRKEFIKTFYSTVAEILKNILSEQYPSKWMVEQYYTTNKKFCIINKYLEANQ